MCRLLPAPKPGKDDVRNLSGNHPFDGARVSNILPSVADELNLDETDGVVIVAVRSEGVAGAARTSSRATSSCRSDNDKITDVIVSSDELIPQPQRMWSVSDQARRAPDEAAKTAQRGRTSESARCGDAVRSRRT